MISGATLINIQAAIRQRDILELAMLLGVSRRWTSVFFVGLVIKVDCIRTNFG